MRSNLFWLSDERSGRIQPLLPGDVRGKIFPYLLRGLMIDRPN
jgi:hypothetical protein